MKFRYDINALRALAVSAVILFHYKVKSVPGGFVGVDVFFVVSGYLMTAIIMGGLEEGRFSIWNFYYDRAKRIVPGLMGVCFVLLAAGYILLEPATYYYLASTSISALLFFSNFQFWEATGYFDPQNETKWLLHTWSLSVEWQFYLIYPILLVALHKFSKTRSYIILILWSITLISILLCIWFSKAESAEPATAFYLLPHRAWELLAGGIVALQFRNSERKYSRILLASGFLFIGISAFFYDKDMPWPSYRALLPVFGACLVIAANLPGASLFKNQIIQTIGKWSYSIYLWHWPIAVAAVYFDFTKTTDFNSVRQVLILVAVEILVLAVVIASGGLLLSLTNRMANARLAERRLSGIIAGASALALTVGFAIMVAINEGLPNRRPDGQKEFAAYKTAIDDWDYPMECDGVGPGGNLRPCQLGASDHDTLFIGDSYAEQIYGRFAETAQRDPEKSFTFLTSSGCPPITGIRKVHDELRCNGFVEKALQFAGARNFKRIVLVSLWYGYFMRPDQTFCFVEGDTCTAKQDRSWYFEHIDEALASLRTRLLELRKRGARIVIVGATPSGSWDVPTELFKRKFLGIDTKSIEYIDRNEFEMNAAPVKHRLMSLASSIGATFVDPLVFLCDSQRCPTVDKDGGPYFRDRGHFRSTVVKTSRFQFLDDAAGDSNRVSAVAVPWNNNP
ncbi:MAG: acyltransferase family protein [Methylocella sp.]